jgi:hypothetical protein
MAENKKIRNARKTEVDGIIYDSRLEAYMAGLLKRHNIEFEAQKVYVLQEKFRYAGELIRPICIRIDFYLPAHNIICDTKGFALADNKMKVKMLKWTLFSEGQTPEIIMPKNQKECNALIARLIQ